MLVTLHILHFTNIVGKNSCQFVTADGGFDYSIDFNKTKKKNKNNYTTLKCHLDLKLFYGLLVKKYSNWNQPTSGTLILYERKPNKFDPNLLFSLNFLTV